VGVTFFLLRIYALAEKFLAPGIENNPFDLRAAEVYADAKHVSNLPPWRPTVQARNVNRSLFLKNLVSLAPILVDANREFSQSTA
jgi:hypothetical protein